MQNDRAADTTSADTQQPMPHLLLVEDEPAAREATGLFLELQGFRVTAADSATAALSLLETLAPDLLICDWQLGEDLDGPAVARAYNDRHGVSVIFVTAHPTDELEAATEDLPVDAVFRKPVSLAHLADAVAASIDEHPPQQPSA